MCRGGEGGGGTSGVCHVGGGSSKCRETFTSSKGMFLSQLQLSQPSMQCCQPVPHTRQSHAVA